jgi:diguanylate cyclase (GGDEF)-like protein
MLDTQTLLYASGLVVATAGIAFVLNTILRRDSISSRLWSLGFISGMLATIAYAVWGYAPDLWWIVSIGNGALSFAVAAMWSGFRTYNSRASLLWVAGLGALVVGLAVLIEGPDGGSWAGGAAMFLAIATFAALASVETLRGILRRSINARILTVVFGAVALYYVVRTVVFLVYGETSEEFLQGFGTATTTLINIVYLTLAAISLSVLQWESAGPGPGRSRADDGGAVIGRTKFAGIATDWLRRAECNADPLVLVLLEVDNLEHINIALGNDFGDKVIRSVERVTSESVPTASLVSSQSSTRFAVLTAPPAIGQERAIAERIHTALAEAPVDAAEGLRAIATFGVASTKTSGYSFAALMAAAVVGLKQAELAGPGTIEVARIAEVLDPA